jgi:hypothetical protein
MAVKGGGILFGGPGQAAGTAPIGFNPGEMAEAPEQEANVSPEEQEQYDAFVKNAMNIVYTDKGKVEPQVLARLSTGSKPIDSMAQTVVWLVMMVEQDAKRAGQEIGDDVVFHAGAEILEQLIDISDAAGLHKWKEAEQQGAWYMALDMYREANMGEGGRIDEAAAKEDMDALIAADQEGRGDEVLPGYEQQSEAAIAAAMADQNPTPEEEEVEGEEKTLSARDMGR